MSSEKKYPASDRKLRKARIDGDIAKSRDMTYSAVILSQFLCLYFYWDCFPDLLCFGRRVFLNASMVNLDVAQELIVESVRLLFSLSLPFILCGAIVGIVVDLLQVGVFFLASNFAFKFSRLNLISGLKRIVGIADSRIYLLLPYRCLKIGIILVICVILCWRSLFTLLQHMIGVKLASGQILNAFKGEFFFVLFACSFFCAFLGVIDFVYERRRRVARLMMDAEELKQEFRDSHGDSNVRHLRRQMQLEVNDYGVTNDVRRAKVVITD